jgi:hypothetical protein
MADHASFERTTNSIEAIILPGHVPAAASEILPEQRHLQRRDSLRGPIAFRTNRCRQRLVTFLSPVECTTPIHHRVPPAASTTGSTTPSEHAVFEEDRIGIEPEHPPQNSQRGNGFGQTLQSNIPGSDANGMKGPTSALDSCRSAACLVSATPRPAIVSPLPSKRVQPTANRPSRTRSSPQARKSHGAVPAQSLARASTPRKQRVHV